MLCIQSVYTTFWRIPNTDYVYTYTRHVKFKGRHYKIKIIMKNIKHQMHVPYHSLHSCYDIITTPFVRYPWKVERIDEFVWRIKRFVKVSRVWAIFFSVINNTNIEIVYENKANPVYSIFFGGLTLNDERHLLSTCM